MGPKITYVQASQADPLPTNLKFGFSYKVLDTEFDKLIIAMDTNKQLIYKFWQGAPGTAVAGKKIDHEEYTKIRDADEANDTDNASMYESKSDPFYKAIFTAWTDGPLGDQLNRMDSSIGVEYIYSNMIAMRAGYYYDQDGDVKYPSFGAGLKYNMFQFDFAYIAAKPDHPLSDTMRFSLSVAF